MQLPIVSGPPAPEPLAEPSGTGPLVDAHGRRITYLRLSITDRCNFRCVYCSPANWEGKSRELTPDELVRLASVFVSLGVNRIRLTGGEPLVRDDLVEIARRLRALPGLGELCLTTNAHRLAELAAPLRDAGVDVVNVSLDSMDPAVFKRLSKVGDLSRVLAGVEAASRLGFTRLGLNAVIVEGENDSAEELERLARFAWSVGAVPRFIELMPFATTGAVVPRAELVRRLESRGLTLARAGARSGAGPAEYLYAADERGVLGELGIISAMTGNFCERCNRVRLSASGALRACLGGREEVPLADLLRAGATDAALEARIRAALAAKWAGHRFVEEGSTGLLSMMGIGG